MTSAAFQLAEINWLGVLIFVIWAIAGIVKALRKAGKERDKESNQEAQGHYRKPPEAPARTAPAPQETIDAQERIREILLEAEAELRRPPSSPKPPVSNPPLIPIPITLEKEEEHVYLDAPTGPEFKSLEAPATERPRSYVRAAKGPSQIEVATDSNAQPKFILKNIKDAIITAELLAPPLALRRKQMGIQRKWI